MKRSLVLVFVTAWLLMPTAARADHGIESARGGGHTESPQALCDLVFVCLSGSSTFAAQDGPSGVRGSYHRFVRVESLHMTAFVRGEVDCLEVVGNTATISGEVVQQSPNQNYERFMVIAVDNGHPEEGMTTDAITEQFFFTGTSATDPTTCVTTGASATSIVPLTRGNVTVHDDV